jgi:hypothetical protein
LTVVALAAMRPAIRAAPAPILNAYTLMFAGFLLAGGRRLDRTAVSSSTPSRRCGSEREIREGKDVGYVQLVEFDSRHPAEEIRQALVARGRARQAHLADGVDAAGHERPNHYWELLEVPSQEEAIRSSAPAETKAAHDR